MFLEKLRNHFVLLLDFSFQLLDLLGLGILLPLLIGLVCLPLKGHVALLKELLLPGVWPVRKKMEHVSFE